MRPLNASRVDGLCRPALEVWWHPITEQQRSPFSAENELADAHGSLRGPHLVAGRLAAHAALDALGEAVVPLARGEGGDAVWPNGVVGSIAHTHGIAVAAVSRAGGPLAGVGVDVEHARRRLDPGSSRVVARPEEHAWLSSPPADLVGDPLVALTSAKEVVFKAVFPPTQVRLRFEDAIVRPTATGFDAEILRDVSVARRVVIERVLIDEFVVLLGTVATR